MTASWSTTATGELSGVLWAPILRAATEVKARQRVAVLQERQTELAVLKGRRIGVFGLAFTAGIADCDAARTAGPPAAGFGW